MRFAFLALPLMFAAAPALAQQAAPARPALKVPPELTDPRLADRLSSMSQALGRVLLDMPVGELEAIAQGRQPTAADRQRTVRTSDPRLAQDLQTSLAQARPMLDSSIKALSAALPSMLQGLEQMGDAIERAAANMPSPTYPNR
jgi:hypothetical protein